ncbi:hypothetical protein VTN49DRAFT_5506 [Thermomyces lanuginosus]|uniref:uncharacterized protein n=1 Tax=Thermomyces lanuginosus TaxID=5541 RepID=UPI00374358B2
MSSQQQTVSVSGIVFDAATGRGHVPASMRADGSMRKEIRIRPGYRPPEDIERYRHPKAAALKNRRQVPGAEEVKSDPPQNNNKNVKRRESQRGKIPEKMNHDQAPSKTDVTATEGGRKKKNQQQKTTDSEASTKPSDAVAGDRNVDGKAPVETKPTDPDTEREKKARNLRKKLRQARELRDRRDQGASLLPEQEAKVVRIEELTRELEALGFNDEGEKKEEEKKRNVMP